MKVLGIVACACAALLLAADEKSLLKPTNKAESWRFEQHEGGKGSLKATDEAIEFTVSEIDGTDWHVQAIQTELDLTNGKQYVLKFQAKASESRPIGVSANIDEEDWHNIGLQESVFLGTEFKPYEFTFTADQVSPKKNRIGIVLGDSKGTVTIKDMTLTAK
jgi:hypothetical protein